MKKTLLAFGPFFLSSLAHAGTGGFVEGLTHPFLRFGHVLAMFALGLWTVQRGGRARWLWPLCFALFAVVGATLAGSFAITPRALVVAVFALGALCAAAYRPSFFWGSGIISLFAFEQGFTHGNTGAMNLAGFTAGALVLMGFGMAVATWAEKNRCSEWVRFAGAGIAAASLSVLVFGVA